MQKNLDIIFVYFKLPTLKQLVVTFYFFKFLSYINFQAANLIIIHIYKNHNLMIMTNLKGS